MQTTPTMQSVTVCCRFRPPNAKEKAMPDFKQVIDEIVEEKSVVLIVPAENGQTSKTRFNFDRIFQIDTAQAEVFQYTAAPLCKELFAGYNTTIFAYGQTGSGKTYSMMGDPDSEDHKGIIPRLVDQIFQTIEETEESIEFTAKLSYVEIYNEKIRDLLDPSKMNLKIREGNGGVWIEDVTEHYVRDYEEVLNLMEAGAENRAISATQMNMESSRSHSVFILTLGQRHRTTGTKKGAKLFLVDLAGSESVRKTGAKDETLEEAKHINKSLTALGKVINTLTSGKGHIPYRDSKLTRLLSDSLGGTSKTCLIVTASPAYYNIEETLSTLRFGTRAKAIKNACKVNAEMSVGEYKKLLENAKKQIQSQTEMIQVLDSEVTEMRSYVAQLDPKLLEKLTPRAKPVATSGGYYTLPAGTSLPGSNTASQQQPTLLSPTNDKKSGSLSLTVPDGKKESKARSNSTPDTRSGTSSPGSSAPATPTSEAKKEKEEGEKKEKVEKEEKERKEKEKEITTAVSSPQSVAGSPVAAVQHPSSLPFSAPPPQNISSPLSSPIGSDKGPISTVYPIDLTSPLPPLPSLVSAMLPSIPVSATSPTAASLSSASGTSPPASQPSTPKNTKRIMRMAFSSTQLMYEKTKLQRRVEELEKEKKEFIDQFNETKEEIKAQGETYEEQLQLLRNKEKTLQKQLEDDEAKIGDMEMKYEEIEAKLKEQLQFRKQMEELEKEKEREHSILLMQLRDEKYEIELKLANKKLSEGQMTTEQVKSVLQLAHDHRKQHLAVVEEALEESNRKLKLVADKDDKIKQLQDRLTAAESLCKKLLTEGLRRFKEQQEKSRQDELAHRILSSGGSRLTRSRSLRGQALAQQTVAAMGNDPLAAHPAHAPASDDHKRGVKRMSSMYMPIARKNSAHGHALLPFVASPHKVVEFKVNDSDTIENFF